MESINQALTHQQGELGAELVELKRLVHAHDADAIDGEQALGLCVRELDGLHPKDAERIAGEGLEVLDRGERLELAGILQARGRRIDLNSDGLMKQGLQDPHEMGLILAGIHRRSPGALVEILGGSTDANPVVKLALASIAVQAATFRVRRDDDDQSPGGH